MVSISHLCFILILFPHFVFFILGYGIGEVFNIFPCGQHILYSLLMSRLLVVVGNPESEKQVRKVVQALQPLIVPFTWCVLLKELNFLINQRC